LRSDNRGKYTSSKFKEYFTGEGIEHQLSIAGWPEQNKVAERINPILTERACNMKL